MGSDPSYNKEFYLWSAAGALRSRQHGPSPWPVSCSVQEQPAQPIKLSLKLEKVSEQFKTSKRALAMAHLVADHLGGRSSADQAAEGTEHVQVLVGECAGLHSSTQWLHSWQALILRGSQCHAPMNEAVRR